MGRLEVRVCVYVFLCFFVCVGCLVVLKKYDVPVELEEISGTTGIGTWFILVEDVHLERSPLAIEYSSGNLRMGAPYKWLNCGLW